MSTGHVVSVKIYLAIFVALMVLTFVTVEASTHDFGELNTVIALTIACIKATLVVLFFMHLRYSERLIHVIVVASFFWLALLIVITTSDYFSRGWLPILR